MEEKRIIVRINLSLLKGVAKIKLDTSKGYWEYDLKDENYNRFILPPEAIHVKIIKKINVKESNGRPPISDEKKALIQALLNEGESIGKTAKKLGVAKATVKKYRDKL